MREAANFWRLCRCCLLVAAVAGALASAPVHAAAVNNCHFILGFATLHDLAPANVGSCIDNQTFAVNGDAVQHTTNGLLAWRKSDNWTAFTNGYQTWINGPTGLVKRFNDEWFEWEAPPAETDGVPVEEAPEIPVSTTEVSLGPLIHTDQTMNNCGPAAIAEVLRYYGISHSQDELKAILRPNDPSGMTTEVVAPYVRGIGMQAVVSTRGSDQLLKALIRSGFPVIAEQLVSLADQQLHYRPLEGYDDGRGVFIAADSLLGPRHAVSYAEFDQIWAPTRQLYIVIYPSSKQRALDLAFRQAGTRIPG